MSLKTIKEATAAHAASVTAEEAKAQQTSRDWVRSAFDQRTVRGSDILRRLTKPTTKTGGS